MKKIVLFLLLAAIGIDAGAQQPQRKRVAVVLSGGGAKGMAHIGALKVIERAGIPVDIITGTSMGSIIGGLYAIGYDATTLDSLVRIQDWPFLLSDKVDMAHQSLADRQKQNTYFLSKDITFAAKTLQGAGGVVSGKNLESLFARLTAAYSDSVDFNRLPIPFACVATNIVDNTEYDFHSGVLAEAMRASMSIPGAFAPIRKGDMLLVDGGLRNNYPVDIARAMGADIVIGVTVQGPPRTADDIKNGAGVIGQIVDVNCKNKYEENMRRTDVLVRADTRGYSAASFTPAAIDTLIRRGEEEAMRHWQELVQIRQSLGLDSVGQQAHRQRVLAEAIPQKMRVAHLSFTDVLPADELFLRRKYRIDRKDSLTQADIDDVIASMRVNLYYNDAEAYYRPGPDGYNIDIVAKGKKTSQVNLGVRFDTEEMVALQMNAGLLMKTKWPLEADFTLRLGKRIMARADLAFTPLWMNKLTFSYIYRHNDLNVNAGGTRAYNVTYNEHQLHFNLIDFNVRNFNVTMGARFDYFNFVSMLRDADIGESVMPVVDEHFFSYHADVQYNSEDKWNFATRGARFHAGYAYYTDNFVHYNGHRGFSALNAMWRMSFALGGRLTLQPMVYGRLLFGSEVPTMKRNAIGGEWFGHYLEYQMPFAGMGRMELTDRQFVALQLRLQQRIYDNNYVLAKVVAAQHADKLGSMLRHGPMTGYELAYCYNSLLGPLGAAVGYASPTRKAYFYINLGFEF